MNQFPQFNGLRTYSIISAMAAALSIHRNRKNPKKVNPPPKSKFPKFTAALLLLAVLLFLWSSTTTLISGDVLHFCLSSRKLHNLYCLSAGTHPAFQIPEEIMEQQHRTLSTLDLPPPATCPYGRFYVYDLPSRFNKDVLDQCTHMLPWQDLCKFLTNGAIGDPVAELGPAWHNTHQYALEPIFHARALNHPCRVREPGDAKLFYVPYYGGMDVLRWHFKNVSNDVKDALSLDLIRWPESQQPWYRNLGRDHVFVLGKISYDFRRKTGSSWGTRLLELDEMQNPIKLLIERHPWHENDVGIPHPTHFHPKTDDEIAAWQTRVVQSNRGSLISFAGAARPDSVSSIRSTLIHQCTSVPDTECKFLNCTTGECDRPESIVNLFLESDFCLQPPGDSPTRKSVFDCLVSGCIPVMFDPFTAYYQYPWHLPKEHEKYSVLVEKEDVRKGEVDVVERLKRISGEEKERMRKYIVYQLLPGLVYGDSNSKFGKFEDAFSIAINNLLKRSSDAVTTGKSFT